MIKNIKDKIPDITKLAATAAPNAKEIRLKTKYWILPT